MWQPGSEWICSLDFSNIAGAPNHHQKTQVGTRDLAGRVKVIAKLLNSKRERERDFITICTYICVRIYIFRKQNTCVCINIDYI